VKHEVLIFENYTVRNNLLLDVVAGLIGYEGRMAVRHFLCNRQIFYRPSVTSFEKFTLYFLISIIHGILRIIIIIIIIIIIPAA
jgi:hypothetical protein